MKTHPPTLSLILKERKQRKNKAGDIKPCENTPLSIPIYRDGTGDEL